MDYQAEDVERALRAGVWQPVPAVAVLLGKGRNTIWRWVTKEHRFRSRLSGQRQGRDLELHPQDVLAYLDQRRAEHAAAEQPRPAER